MNKTMGSPEKNFEALSELRKSIDNIDASLIFMLSERFNCTKKVGQLKAISDLAPSDPEREKHQILRLKRLSEQANLDPIFAEKFLRFIIDEVIRQHELIAKFGD